MTIKEIRIARNLTQNELADICKEVDERIDASMISKFENGVCLPSTELAEYLKARFEVDDIESTEEELPPIVQYIPEGKENAILLAALTAVTGYSSRKVRHEIAKARKLGALIINDQDGRGYYQSRNIDDISRQYHQTYSRAMKLLSSAKRMRKIIKENK